MVFKYLQTFKSTNWRSRNTESNLKIIDETCQNFISSNFHNNVETLSFVLIFKLYGARKNERFPKDCLMLHKRLRNSTEMHHNREESIRKLQVKSLFFPLPFTVVVSTMSSAMDLGKRCNYICGNFSSEEVNCFGN